MDVTAIQRKCSSRPRRRVESLLLALAATVSLALAAHPAPALAGEFTINACQADRGNYSTRAFDDFATRGMMWKRACNPEGPGLRGLVTANVSRAGRVARGARSYFVMRAPDGTRFARLSWSGQARRRDCRYALQVWASRPDGPPAPVKNVRANLHCPRPGRAQAAGWPRAHSYDIAGATSIVQRVVCVGSTRKPYCSARGLNYIRTFKAQATVVDVSAPMVSIVQDNPFTRGAWVRGLQPVTYAATDNTGVRVGRAIVHDIRREEQPRPCNYAQRVPCANGPGTITVETGGLSEGSQPLVVQGEDASGNLGYSRAVTIRVDNTAPGAVPVAIEGGDAWRNQNGFDLVWANPAEGDRAPIAGAHYQLCRSRTDSCTSGGRSAPGIATVADLQVPAAGEWQVRLWREDSAGNQEPANASVPVSLRYDPVPPTLGFEATTASDPTLVSVLAIDRVSGIAGGQIEISRQGSGTWQTLATQLQGDHLMARVDDSRLPAGTYVLRVSGRDRASNESSTDRRFDGQPMTLELPLRVTAAMRAGVVKSRTVRKTVRRRGKRRTIRRKVTVLKARARVGFGRRVKVGGRLENGDGQSIAGAEVLVFSRTATGVEQPLGTVHTDARGRYVYWARANATRTLRFVYPGTARILPGDRQVTLFVPAASTFRARPRRLHNGKAVHFAGRLRSLPAPMAGKLVELQVVLSGRWQTFRTVRTGPAGAWRVPYRFRRSCGVVRYRFRARLPAEAGYPFVTGVTHAVVVSVRGALCT